MVRKTKSDNNQEYRAVTTAPKRKPKKTEIEMPSSNNNQFSLNMPSSSNYGPQGSVQDRIADKKRRFNYYSISIWSHLIHFSHPFLFWFSSHYWTNDGDFEANEQATMEAIRISKETIEALTNTHFMQSSPQDSPQASETTASAMDVDRPFQGTPSKRTYVIFYQSLYRFFTSPSRIFYSKASFLE